MKKILLLIHWLPLCLLAQTNKVGNSNTAMAVSIIETFSEGQKKKALFPIKESNRYDWHYFPHTMVPRNGVALKDLSPSQKESVYNLLKLFLSREGFDKTKRVMSLENVLHELEPDNASRINENYFIAFYGMPGKDSAWAWKFGGHHLALNFTIVNDQIAFAPFFFGANPAIVKSGPQKGFRAIREEEDYGFELVKMLSARQQQKAVFRLSTFTDIVTTNSPKLSSLEPVGILASEMTNEQKIVLNKLIASYIHSMKTNLAKIRMQKILREDMDLIRFGWAGATETGKPHYYRVQGKTFLIEFDNSQNNANHIHSVWRDFNGDYGEDLLKEHYMHSGHHKLLR